MKSATIKKKTVKQKVLELQITMEEAKALYIALAYIGGSPHNSARRYTDNIFHALCKAKILNREFGKKVDRMVDQKKNRGFYFAKDSDIAIDKLKNY